MDDEQTRKILARFPRSPIWDDTTQNIVDASRAFIHRQPQPTISQLQENSLRSRPLDDSFHIVSTTIPVPPEDDARLAFFKAIQSFGKLEHENPQAAEIKLEWLSHRTDRAQTTGPRSVDTRESVAALSAETESKATILHIHGGGMFQGSPASYRATTSRLAKLARCRVVSIEHRLCPQHLFPACALDVFIAYLTLLYPPPGSPHPPIDPSTIVIAGDSSGALLGFSLLQTLTQAKKLAPMSFHSRRISFPLPYPAGIAGMSTAGEQLQAMRSYETNRVHDFFLDVPWAYPDYPSCQIWPKKPPSASIMGRDILGFTNPTISPCLATNWAGCPPMWFGCGEEQYLDGAKAIARRANQQGVHVSWYEFEGMPHCFAASPGLNRSKHASMLMEQWAYFCRLCVDEPGNLKASPQVLKVRFKDLKKERMALETVDDPTFEEIEHMVKARLDEMQREFDRVWSPKKDGTAKL